MTDILEKLREELARYSYRPNWALSIVPKVSFSPGCTVATITGYELSVVMRVVNSRDGETEIEVPSGQPVPADLLHYCDCRHWKTEFSNWLTQCIRKLEIHESREWLRRDGKLTSDPHADGRTNI